MTLSKSAHDFSLMYGDDFESLKSFLGSSDYQIEPLAGDASTRKYFRISQGMKKFVLMKLFGQDKAALEKDSYSWLQIYKNLEQTQVNLPKIHKIFKFSGSILLEDCGSESLEHCVHMGKNVDSASLVHLYKPCFEVIGHFLKLSNKAKAQGNELWQQRSFSHAFLLKELVYFQTALLSSSQDLGLKLNSDLFLREADTLSETISKLPYVFTHRDYHSRNIFIKERKYYIIDFQDARLGPVVYDLVSLCFDPYVTLSWEERLQLLTSAKQILSAELPTDFSEIFEESFVPVFFQRQIKILGSYLALSKQPGKQFFSRYISPTLAILSEVSDERWPYLCRELIPQLKSLYH